MAAAADLTVVVHDADADPDALDALAGGLREELLALDVDDVDRARAGAPPPGARGLDVAALGALVVSLQASTALLDQVVGTIRGWLRRGGPGRSVEITVGDATIKLDGATDAQQERLVREFVRAVAKA